VAACVCVHVPTAYVCVHVSMLTRVCVWVDVCVGHGS
jgi:hypothetical protein